MNKVLELLNQQSTWKGLIGLAAAIGLVLTPEQTSAIVAAAMGAMGVINVFRNENK